MHQPRPIKPDSPDRGYRDIPSVHRLLEAPQLKDWIEHLPRRWVVDAARQVLDDHRRVLARGDDAPGEPDCDEWVRRIVTALQLRRKSKLRAVINATGVILHTGLGRAPLAGSAVSALLDVADRYASVEIDLTSGRRSQRVSVVAGSLCSLTGAQAATVVNNNAAATLIVLAALTNQGSTNEVIVSRGELVEIGGSFRLPQIMKASSAVLREVGTTNKTYVHDYEEAIGINSAALMKVHTSNYQVTGFTQSVAITELVQLGKKHAVPVVHDIGSGALADSEMLEQEPRAAESIRAGADLVLFSGDKLLGGPQSGIIVGNPFWVSQVERHPLMRAMRVDKLTLAALEATLRLHADPARAAREVPVMVMARTPIHQLRRRAEVLAKRIGGPVQITPSVAYLGGGSMPSHELSSVALTLRGVTCGESELAHRLRTGNPSVVGRIQEGLVWLDLRTVLPEQDQLLAAAVHAAVENEKSH